MLEEHTSNIKYNLKITCFCSDGIFRLTEITVLQNLLKSLTLLNRLKFMLAFETFKWKT